MSLELRLTKDERLLLSIPLSGQDLPLPPFRLDDREIERLSSIYSIGANQKRLRVMAELARGRELRFSDVMQIVTNPKLAQDCLQPLMQQGFLVHQGRGTGYRFAPKALPLMTIVTEGLAKMITALESEPEERQ